MFSFLHNIPINIIADFYVGLHTSKNQFKTNSSFIPRAYKDFKLNIHLHSLCLKSVFHVDKHVIQILIHYNSERPSKTCQYNV